MVFLNTIKKSGLKFILWEIFWQIKFLTPVKFINYLKITYGNNFSKPWVVKELPVKLTIDTSANCILHCPLCPTGQNDKTRARGEMKFSDFKKIIDEIGKNLLEIDLFNWGEPFLNNAIFKMISLCFQRKIISRLSSNLNYFPDDYAKKLVQSKLNHLVVSLDGITKETYNRYRVGGSLEKVLTAVGRIKKEKEKQNLKLPFITWQFIVFDHNKNEVEQAKKLVKKWGFDRIVFIENRGDMGDELFVKKNNNKKTRCHFLWNQSVINWNGLVSPCCLYYNEKYDFGNAFENGFLNVWNNDKYQTARKMVISKRTVDKDIICTSCIKNGFPS